MVRRIGVVLALVLVVGAFAPAATAHLTKQEAVVKWHGQQQLTQHGGNGLSGDVAGAKATIIRTHRGVFYWLKTSGLQPGNAYTLWLVLIDNPEGCLAVPCAAPDFLANAAPDAQVLWGAGRVARSSGMANLFGFVRTGDLEGWLPDRSFDEPFESEIHLVVNDHGPAIDEFMPGMIQTYRGGCKNESPFPPPFPPTALSDGAVGPNTCLLNQFAVFPGL